MARRKHEHYDAIRAGVEAGVSVRDLEKEFGVGRGTISKWAKRDGWTKPERKPETGNRKPRKETGKPKGRVSGGKDKKPGPARTDRKPGQQWTEKERAEALVVYVETASVAKTASVTGVPARTMYRWLDEDPRWREAASSASRVCARILEDRAEYMLLRLIGQVESEDPKHAAAGMRAIADLTKTLSFIRGGPSERTEGTTSPEEWRRGRSTKPL